MIRLVRAELLKLRTTRIGWALLAVVVALAGVVTWLVTWRGIVGGSFAFGYGPGTVSWYRSVLNDGSLVETFALVLGIVVVTAEHRHGTITSTLLAEPRRERVVGAKLVASMLAGGAYGLTSCAVVLAVAAVVCAHEGVGVGGLLGQVPVVWPGLVAATALQAVYGAAVGALLRNQVQAVVVALVFSIVAFPVVVGLFPSVGRWLPDAATAALSSASTRTHQGTGISGPAADLHLLRWWAGGLVLLGYGVVLAGLGSVAAVRSDVT